MDLQTGATDSTGPTSKTSDASGWVTGAMQTVFHLAYPLLVYLAYTRLETRELALGLLALYLGSVALRLRGSWHEIWGVLRQHLGLGVLIALAVATDNRTILLFLPVMVNLYLLWTFGSSLRTGPPMIERFARIVEDDLPDFTLPYCRKVTIAWCGFLALNAISVVSLSLWAPVSWWALYTGLLAYLLIGGGFAGEFVLRKLWFRHYDHTNPVDRLFARVFPAERTANGRRSLAYVVAREAAAGP